MQANRIRPAGCPGAEDARLRPTQVSAWMHPQDTAVRLVQPGQHHDLVPDRNAERGASAVEVSGLSTRPIGRSVKSVEAASDMEATSMPEQAAGDRAGTARARRVVA